MGGRRISFKIRKIQVKSLKKEISTLKNIFIKINCTIPFQYRQKSLLMLSRKNKKFNFSKTKKYCGITGRLGFNLKNLNISRMVLKELVSSLRLSGFYKSS